MHLVGFFFHFIIVIGSLTISEIGLIFAPVIKTCFINDESLLNGRRTIIKLCHGENMFHFVNILLMPAEQT